jgi:hypothetical protein
MKTVNLLPPWYLQRHRGRRRLRGHLAAMAVLAAAVVAAAVAARDRAAVLRASRDVLAAELARVPDLEPDLKRKEADLKRMADLQLAYRELGKTIPMSSVLQQLQNDLAPGMALCRVGLDVRPDPVKGSGVVGDLRNPPALHNVLYLAVEGIAPNDGLIAGWIEKLSANPLFTDVSLDYARAGTLKTFLVRRFEIKMKMDLDSLTTEDPAAPADPAPGKSIASGGTAHAQ